jgi:alanine-glyoxylate transaminase/serine-glyoxylate transaminase/serine-pyruvate transaminase
MSAPVVGHLDPSFLDVMDDVQELLRYAFQTENEWTIPVSGTGSAAMEAAFANLVEPDDVVLVPDNGYFGQRMASMAHRAGGDVETVQAAWGEPLAVDDVGRELTTHDPDVFAFVHAETSTGVRQHDVDALTDLAHDHDALVIADAVTSLGGVEFRVDEWGIDVAYSASQKCLSCPPGASPLTLSSRAMAKIQGRDTPVRSWYLDLSELGDYWGEKRAYHHTAPVTNIYALREALRIVAEEGIETRWERHERVAGALVEGVKAMGLELNASTTAWLPSLNAVRLPDGVDDGAVIEYLLEEYDIEIASGLGDLSGDILRIGCMGYSAKREHVFGLVGALGDALTSQGVDADTAAGLDAVRRSFEHVDAEDPDLSI